MIQYEGVLSTYYVQIKQTDMTPLAFIIKATFLRLPNCSDNQFLQKANTVITTEQLHRSNCFPCGAVSHCMYLMRVPQILTKFTFLKLFITQNIKAIQILYFPEIISSSDIKHIGLEVQKIRCLWCITKEFRDCLTSFCLKTLSKPINKLKY